MELHSNFTVEGSKTTIDGVLPTNHAEHKTVEITQGVTDWFETGFYIFTSIQSDGGWQWVGRSHPPTLPHTGVVALAGRGEFVERDRLPAPRILS